MSETPQPNLSPTVPGIVEKLRAKADFGIDPPKPAPKTVEIKADDAAIRRVSKLERDALDYKAKIAELETSAVNARAFEDSQRLLKEGKQLDAIRVIAGAGFTQEQEDDLVMAILETQRAPKTPADAKIDELAKKIEADGKARESLESRLDAKTKAEEQANVSAFAMHALDGATNDDGTPRFELCAHPENRADAARLAVEHAVTLAVARGVDPEHVSPDQMRELLQDAYADVEAELEAEGVEREKELARFRKTKVPANPATTRTPQTTGAEQVRQEPQVGRAPLAKPATRIEPPQPAHSLDAVLQKVRERARY